MACHGAGVDHLPDQRECLPAGRRAAPGPSRSRSDTSPAAASRAPITATYGTRRSAASRTRAPSEPSAQPRPAGQPPHGRRRTPPRHRPGPSPTGSTTTCTGAYQTGNAPVHLDEVGEQPLQAADRLRCTMTGRRRSPSRPHRTDRTAPAGGSRPGWWPGSTHARPGPGSARRSSARRRPPRPAPPRRHSAPRARRAACPRPGPSPRVADVLLRRRRAATAGTRRREAERRVRPPIIASTLGHLGADLVQRHRSCARR